MLRDHRFRRRSEAAGSIFSAALLGHWFRFPLGTSILGIFRKPLASA